MEDSDLVEMNIPKSAHPHPFKMCCRVRPSEAGKNNVVTAVPVTKTVYLSTAQGNAEVFTYNDGVFDENDTNQIIYNNAVTPLLGDLLCCQDEEPFCLGKSALLAACGTKCSGKTFLMMGGVTEEGLAKSIIFLAMRNILAFINRHNEDCSPNEQLQLKLKMIEVIYSKKKGAIRNLLGTNEEILQLRDNGPRGTTTPVLPDGTPLDGYLVTNPKDGLGIVKQAEGKRKKRVDGKNAAASRSHSVCQLEISYSSDDATDKRISTFFMVDLAGSDLGAVPKGVPRRPTLVELNASKYIKNSLNIIRRAFMHKKKEIVTYRDDPLTRLLQSHLDSPEQYRTLLIINVNVSDA